MSSAAHALPGGYAINEYRIESVLGEGGFGLTYLATDANLNLKVALKEYLPADFASRGADNTVEPKSASTAESFQWGLRRFLDEARTLASFRHPHIVRVMRFFEANHTAYMVMEFVEGEQLPRWIVPRRPLPQAALVGLMAPLLDGLDVIHKAGFLHRDIKPANISIRGDGSAVLLDFGSARELKGGDQELTAVVSPGYAPFEQYHSHGKQGPWSDIYAFGGVLYWMVTGLKPVEAAARIRQDVMPTAVAKGNPSVYTQDFLSAIDWALKPHEDDRPQNVADFRSRLGADAGTRTTRTTSAADAPTVLAQPATQTGMTTIVAAGNFDRDTLKRIEAELAKHVGPIAPVVVRNAARKSTTIEDLCNAAAKEIEDEKNRASFLKKMLAGERSQPPSVPSKPTGLTQVQPPTQAASAIASATQKFPGDLLQKAEAALAQHIGAIAKVVVRRAAGKARDEAELYLLIADEIKDPVEKKAFIRKAVSVSRPT